MAFESFNQLLVCDETITNIKAGNQEVGYEFKIQYPSYRGTFLSCIEKITVKVDGKLIDNGQIGFYINGKEVLIDELPELFREYWFTTDYARVRVYGSGLELESKHLVDVFLRHRIPYTGYFGNYMVEDSVCTKELEVV